MANWVGAKIPEKKSGKRLKLLVSNSSRRMAVDRAFAFAGDRTRQNAVGVTADWRPNDRVIALSDFDFGRPYSTFPLMNERRPKSQDMRPQSSSNALLQPNFMRTPCCSLRRIQLLR
jgi:hypothetical protein